MDELEALLHRLDGQSALDAAETLKSWRKTGALHVMPTSSNGGGINAPSEALGGQDGRDDNQQYAETPTFESPLGEEYLYDRDG